MYKNGQTYISNGVSVCQSKEGLFQKIKFNTPVKTATNADCNIKGEGTEFEFKIKKDYCVTLFKELNSGKLHKLTTVGYENILIRR